MCCDSGHAPEQTIEAPVPAGLGKLADAQRALADLCGIGDSLIEAAEHGSSALSPKSDRRAQFGEWLAAQIQVTKDKWLIELLDDQTSATRLEILAKFRRTSEEKVWPTAIMDRTIAELWESAEEIHRKKQVKVAATAARKRAAKLKKMATDPAPYLKETEQLATERTANAYRKASKLLAELHEALAHNGQDSLVEKQALKLKNKNPTRRQLVTALRREGFVPK